MLFFTINLNFVTSNQIPTYRKAHFYLLPLEMQSRLKQTKVYHTLFYFAWKEVYNSQTFKSGSSKKPFLQCVFYWYNLHWWMFFILCDNWKTLLFIIVYSYSEIVCHVVAFFEGSVLKEIHIFCVISTIMEWCQYQSFKIKLIMLLKFLITLLS